MIFSSVPFLFGFLPITLLGCFLLARIDRRAAAVWIVGASLVFYGYWIPRYIPLLLGSIAWNYAVGAWVFRTPVERERGRLAILWLGIAGDLALLGWFKYAFPLIGFLAEHGLAPTSWEGQVLLPLGVSFFTFTQIGYLVDSYDGRAKERDLLSYGLFVTFFPHLIAGPIYHNREIMPQFGRPEAFRLRADNLSVGMAIFILGMAKKVLLADPLGYSADNAFAQPGTLGAGAAWLGVLAYSLQLYFDFSGYSDMAIGLGRMIGITFPANFNAPYRSASIIDFWSRWHMTLTRYITLYLYNPIAVRVTRARVRRGKPVTRAAMRTPSAYLSGVVFPMTITMGLAGIWHGAGLQFLIFGLLHAGFLSVNHGWRLFGPAKITSLSWTVTATVLTYLCVLVAQIFFRAGSAGEAVAMLQAMAGANGEYGVGTPGARDLALRIALGFGICLLLPTTQQIMRDHAPVLEKVSPAWPAAAARLRWRPGIRWGVALGVLLLAALLRASDVSKFLYFQF